MSEIQQNLLAAFEKLMSIKGECNDKVCDLHNVAEMTVNQINYLKIIDRHANMTFSLLAEKTKITKPSVTGLINKLEALGCVYKEPCTHDKRVTYIRLTQKGMNIARHERTAVENLIRRIMMSLDEQETKALVQTLNKVK